MKPSECLNIQKALTEQQISNQRSQIAMLEKSIEALQQSIDELSSRMAAQIAKEDESALEA